MLSFSAYFLLKKPARQDFFSSVSFTTVLGASDTGFSSVFAAIVFGFVVLVAVLVDFADDFGFFVAMYSSFIDISFIIAQILCDIIKNMAIMMNREDDKNQELAARIQADLRARAKKTKDLDADEDFDVYVFPN